jgi:tetratricopeptide (TPR) repeat protein
MWIQLAKSEKALGHTEGTFNAILKAAEVSPDNGLMLAVVGFSYINLGRIPQAIPPLERAARLMPRNYLIQSQLGNCLEAVGQIDAGISHLRQGASLNSSYGPVWEHLGLAYRKKGSHREAAKAFERATQLMPTARFHGNIWQKNIAFWAEQPMQTVLLPARNSWVLPHANRAKRSRKRRTRERARRFVRSNSAAEDASEIEKLPPQLERRELFQKQTHTVKIDDAVTDEEQIHPQDPIDSRVALL